MSGERIIQQADIRQIEAHLQGLHSGLEQVGGLVAHVTHEVSEIDDRLARLTAAFSHFVDEDRKAKALQLAQTRRVEVRQELEHEYGHHEDVRRHATGILQAADVGLVRQETITTATEELMLAAPRYWLAPSLVALAAWLADDRALAERAVLEGERRDREKTTLFFALVCRRLGRYEASSAWLARFFSLQDPTELPREAVVMVDAVAAGIFGGDARVCCTQTMQGWIAELAGRAGFVETQREQWRNALLAHLPPAPATGAAYLPKHSETWASLQSSLRGAGLHAALAAYFTGIFEGVLPPATSLAAAVDDLLDKLTSEYDAEELPLRREERLLTLVIESRGDEDEAKRRAGLEQQALAGRITFTQLLTNAAMHPETSHASRETQRLAIALSRDWIAQAHQDLTAANRASVPAEVTVEIEGWRGVTRDGANETELVRDLEAHLGRKEQAALDRVKLGPPEYAALGVGILFVLGGLLSGFNWFLLLVGFACVGWFFYSRSQLETRRQKVRQEFTKLRDDCRVILKGCIAEVVDWRRAYAGADTTAIRFGELLESISPEQFVLATHDRARAIVASQT